ncbi:orotidine 5'-phosphate decarboxylase / HUMPS family protein [Lacticaseibacillus saniviri]|uniref:Orotidine 5'-phosphate decarboxylase domain-containing protein n=1 Tax=Lacticaseibacillus saniviri JCM 17471 = DSM 24301 TaxID=1293598 RepID=A0A0R2MPG2_9LACO|nr:orotidine 5'-phosphate decarboxylase / HUMPS family protein [Lacticaseibacillus saniviri]KRO15567.1 hypothetical protein IV56_GL002336 [Lacticaseibacillus saniviri JCM 17471 = DSM 24301]MCG4282691.1 orotidine 5'-phosphate decarboxylase [Lacticaseibacillus saniviri]
MQLQVAIDRVTLDAAVAVAKQLDGHTDIIEMGTSLVKDYGFAGIQAMHQAITKSKLLVDLKTIDEGPYEFKQGYAAGADILTVMGASSTATLDATYQVAEDQGKQMMIDLLEVDDTKLATITHYPNAIYALHHSVDRADKMNPVATVADFHAAHPEVAHLAIAGGINLDGAKELAEQGLTDIVIVGSTIMKAADPVAATQTFMEAMN